MKSRPWCSTCNAFYRGIYPVHASTEKHKRLASRRHTPSSIDRHALGKPKINMRRMLAGDTGADHEKVRSYRRRRPLDGPRFSVRVHNYFRRRAWHPTKY